MDDKRARLVDSGRNILSGGQCELWDVGNGRGIYVSSKTFVTGVSNTVAVQVDLIRRVVTNWSVLGAWVEDATGGKAIRELGYETEEDE